MGETTWTGPAAPRVVEAEWAAAERAGGADRDDERSARDLHAFWGPDIPPDRAPRILGLFAHPDDEVFCLGGTIARCAGAGAVTMVASLTHGEAGQIRDATTATRRTLGEVRARELERSTTALGVDHVTCLDLGDGQLASLPLAEVAAVARGIIEGFEPDVVVTFGPDGAFGDPDHVTSCLAVVEALRDMSNPPRLLHAKFPVRGQLMVDLIVEWLRSEPRRKTGTAAFGNALKRFALGTSMLGLTSDHVRVEWYPEGSFIVEQGEPAKELYCVLSGTAEIVSESRDGTMWLKDTTTVGTFFGEAGLATGRPRNAHVIAQEPVTCLVFSREEPSLSAGPGAGADVEDQPDETAMAALLEDCVLVNVSDTLERKVDALVEHRSQYALERDLLPMSMFEHLLGTERFVVTHR